MNNYVVVVDANIAIKLAIAESDSHIAVTLFEKWRVQKKLILAPALFVYEITNILLKKVRQSKMTIEDAKKITSAILDTGIEIYWPLDPDLPINALGLAHNHNLPATYDAHYLTLAEREQCEFWTADERLYNSVKDQLSWVRFMAADASASTSA
jgi:predicted nucleic acid-binding protein